MRRPKSRCPPTGSDRGTRFPFRIKRVFPFSFFFFFLFSAWQAEGFLNWSWRSSIRSVTKLAKEDTEENFPPRPKEAPAPALRRVKRARPPPAGEKGAFSPLSTAGAGCSQSGFVVPGICRAEGVWRLSVHSGLRRGFSQIPVGSLHPHPQHTQWLPCRSLYRFLKAHLSDVRFCGNQQPLLRAPTAQRAATCGNKQALLLRKVPPHPFRYPTGWFPSASGRAKGERRGHRHLVILRPGAERTDASESGTARRRRALLSSQHQGAPETAGVPKRPRGRATALPL